MDSEQELREMYRAAEVIKKICNRRTEDDSCHKCPFYTMRKLKVTGVTDESIYAGNMKFSIKALDDALFTEEPGKEGDAE